MRARSRTAVILLPLVLTGTVTVLSACGSGAGESLPGELGAGASITDVNPTPSGSPTASDGTAERDGVPLYLAEANMGDGIGAQVPTGMLGGVRGVITGGPVPGEFAQRLLGVDPGLTTMYYAPEAYDAVVVAALAAASAGSDAGADIAAAIPVVTSGTQECSEFGSCLAMLTAGQSIAYRGVSGASHLTGSGEPATATAGVYTFGPANTVLANPDFRQMTLSSVGSTPAATHAPGAGSGDGVLRIGLYAPAVDPLSFLQPAVTAGVRLAIADIATAGGVPGFTAVELVGDPTASASAVASASTSAVPSASATASAKKPASPRPSATSTPSGTASGMTADPVRVLLASRPDVVIGPASSDGMGSVAPAATSAGIVVMSPTHARRDDLPVADRGLLWSMEPGATLPGALLGTLVTGDGHSRVAILAVNNSYGVGLSQAVSQAITSAGGTVVTVQTYAPDATDFAGDVAAVKAAHPDAIVLLGTEESGAVATELIKQGIGPHATP